jgi:enoyl-CoA hydratase/3-hydroxyacyl-CoA dehydrogenase
MICFARSLNVWEAMDAGMVTKVVGDYPDLIREAVEEVKNIAGKIKRIPDGKVEIPAFTIPDPPMAAPMAGKQALSKEAVSITLKTIQAGAAAATFAEALEIGYQGNAEIACTEAAKEGITAFLEKRRPEFKK